MATMPRSPIHIEFRRSGGFAGISLTATATADELPAEQAAQVQRLLAADMPPPAPDTAPGGGGADRFQYQLDLDDGQQHRSFAWDEAQVPEPIRPVLGALTRLATPG
jgi:emfourin